FLETRKYDHPTWPVYCEQESITLIATESTDWDQRYLSRLHLFGVILADENEWNRMYGRPSHLAMEDVFAKLVRDDSSRLLAIFSSYASFDPPAAFRPARRCGVVLLEEPPELLMETLALPPFLAMVFEQMRAEPHRVVQWATVLAEGALTQEA